MLGVSVAVAVCEAVSVGGTVTVGVSLGVCVAVAVAAAVPVGVAVWLGVAVGTSGWPSQPPSHVSSFWKVEFGQPAWSQNVAHATGPLRASTQNPASQPVPAHTQHCAAARVDAPVANAATIAIQRSWLVLQRAPRA